MQTMVRRSDDYDVNDNDNESNCNKEEVLAVVVVDEEDEDQCVCGPNKQIHDLPLLLSVHADACSRDSSVTSAQK